MKKFFEMFLKYFLKIFFELVTSGHCVIIDDSSEHHRNKLPMHENDITKVLSDFSKIQEFRILDSE